MVKSKKSVPVAQRIERWPPEPEAGVRVSPGTPNYLREYGNSRICQYFFINPISSKRRSLPNLTNAHLS